MKDQFRYFSAGIFIGISELLPGISGATVALMFGVYEKLLEFLRKFKNLNLIMPLLFGMITSVFLFSSLINFLYDNYTNTFNFFIALLMVVYGIFLVINTYLNGNIQKGMRFYINISISILVGIFLTSFTYNYENFSFNLYFLIIIGFIACSFLLFPGISGSAFLLSVGAYSTIIGSISSLNFNVLIPFGMGMLFALFLMPRLINKAYIKFGKSILVFFGGLIFTAGTSNLFSLIYLA